MDKTEGKDHILAALQANDNKKCGEKTSRKTIVKELVEDNGVSKTTAYEWYRETYQEYRWESSKSSTGYQAIHPLQILEDAEDLLQGVPVDDPEQKMKLQKHYATYSKETCHSDHRVTHPLRAWKNVFIKRASEWGTKHHPYCPS